MAPPDTRTQLLLAAEQLFGERGIHAVSLREVNQAAGQRNTSASHYHFGSKQALIRAIFAYRRPGLVERRMSMFEELTTTGRQLGAREIVHAWLTPLIEPGGDSSGRGTYVSFLAQMFLQPPDNWREVVLTERDSDYARFLSLLSPLVLGMPPRLIEHRTLHMTGHWVLSQALRGRVQAEFPGSSYLPDDSAFHADQIDGSMAYLTAPASDEVRSAFASIANVAE